jgi:hypothetical protein
MSLLNPQSSVAATQLEPFTLLAALCRLVSSEVQVYVHEPGWPYRAEFNASLARVQSLVPGGGTIIFEFEGGESLSLGPSEVVDFHVAPTGVQPAWVELELRCGSSLWIERVANETPI